MKTDPRAEIPARQAWQRGQKKKSHFLSPRKAKGVIQTESGLEASFAFGCDLHPKVKSIRPQPCTFDLKSGRRYKTKTELLSLHKGTGYRPKPYTPDFEVLCSGQRRVFVEVRHSRLLRMADSVLLLPKLFEGLGLELLIITDEYLNKTLVHNIRTLSPYVGTSPSAPFDDVLSAASKPNFRLGELLSNTPCRQDDILRAVVSGKIAVDLNTELLGPNSIGREANGSRSHLEILPL